MRSRTRYGTGGEMVGPRRRATRATMATGVSESLEDQWKRESATWKMARDERRRERAGGLIDLRRWDGWLDGG